MAKVYALYLDTDPRFYIGCTRGSTTKRLREHRCLLRAGKHTCKPLQEAYDAKEPRELFMKHLDECGDDLQSRRAAELKAMQQFRSKLFNEAISFRPTEEARVKGVEASRGVVGNRWTPEANEKRRMAQLGKPKGHGAKISATKQARKAQQVMR